LVQPTPCTSGAAARRPAGARGGASGRTIVPYLFICLVAVLNVAVGFMLAVRLGRRWRLQTSAPADDGLGGVALGWEPGAAVGGPTLSPASLPGQQDRSPLKSPLLGAEERLGLAAQLNDWWKGDPQHTRPLCIAMLDLDQLLEIKTRHGGRLGDRLLQSINQLLQMECLSPSRVCRLAGDAFFFLLPDVDVQEATSRVERLRQMLELTRFRYQEENLRVTASCAITAATGADTSDTLFGRMEAAIREANRYGRNRSFVYEGKYPTPVIPPSFTLEEKEIVL